MSCCSVIGVQTPSTFPGWTPCEKMVQLHQTCPRTRFLIELRLSIDQVVLCAILENIHCNYFQGLMHVLLFPINLAIAGCNGRIIYCSGSCSGKMLPVSDNLGGSHIATLTRLTSHSCSRADAHTERENYAKTDGNNVTMEIRRVTPWSSSTNSTLCLSRLSVANK